MPELPEVENIRKTLLPHLLGRRIVDVQIYIDRMIKYPQSSEFAQNIVGVTINNVLRRGKYLLFVFDDEKLLVVHLRMTGALIVTEKDEMPAYARIKFSLSDGSILWYTDVRTLGTLHLLNKGENPIKGLRELGPEPLSVQMNAAYLKDKITGSKKSIKAVLLDQSIIAGIGNIYADEALHIAKIRPDKKAGELTDKQIKLLCQAIVKVISQAIENKGTSFRDYKDGDGQKGQNQDHLLVYGRKNKPCYTCTTPIEYQRTAGRGTCFCPKCQN